MKAHTVLGVERKHFTISTPTRLTLAPLLAWLTSLTPHYLLICRALERPCARRPVSATAILDQPSTRVGLRRAGTASVPRLPTTHLASIFHLTLVRFHHSLAAHEHSAAPD